VPSVAESGWPAYEATAWYGFAVPKGTPKDIADKLRKATVETITTGVVRERLEAEAAEPIGNSPEEFAAMMKAESARWAEIVKKASISIDLSPSRERLRPALPAEAAGRGRKPERTTGIGY
jgi:tripartite-type tricarboxylate transporter receptor subunit TctC